MTTTLNTSCSENTIYLSARRGVSACMSFLVNNNIWEFTIRLDILLPPHSYCLKISRDSILATMTNDEAELKIKRVLPVR
jgi:hypothetical protein